MQSYTGDGEIAFTNIYQGSPSQTIGRAEGDNNKADAKAMAAVPEMIEALQWFIDNTPPNSGVVAALAALIKAGVR